MAYSKGGGGGGALSSEHNENGKKLFSKIFLHFLSGTKTSCLLTTSAQAIRGQGGSGKMQVIKLFVHFNDLNLTMMLGNDSQFAMR